MPYSCAVLVASEILTWNEFEAKYGRSRKVKDEERRHQEVFEANVRDIEAINSRYLSYAFGVDEFSDLTVEESMSMLPGSPTPSDEGDNSTLTHKKKKKK